MGDVREEQSLHHSAQADSRRRPRGFEAGNGLGGVKVGVVVVAVGVKILRMRSRVSDGVTLLDPGWLAGRPRVRPEWRRMG